MVNTAHPSFVGIIERLSPDEARIIKYLRGKEDIQYCDFYGNVNTQNEFVTIQEHLTLIPHEVHLEYSQNINAYLSNLLSMGILYDVDNMYRADQTIYNKIKEVYGLDQLKKQFVPDTYKSITTKDSFYQITDLGQLFIKACIND